MHGIYQPLFGLNNPDHTALHQRLKGLNQRTIYKVTTIGSAPNVPFINFHYVDTPNGIPQKSKGYLINLGGRFVTAGLSFQLSHWAMETNNNSHNLKHDRTATTTGGWIDPIGWNIEYVYIKQEFLPGKHDSGAVTTLQTKLRTWREIYAILNYSDANVTQNLGAGSSNEITAGIKSYLISGLELEGLYRIMKNTPKDKDAATTNKSYQIQVHTFF